ncbi:hypothetical protein Pint_05920 [Pistacia integerrima]|uniref:Uncharacterized protein n=1 Tax=Pistacia integerrima TaxID=434235 RepID=A0ACC0Z5Y1_9ROSI|nr:hypothetical protein Pint_05920 [Pistacia integerrima]
MKSEKSKLTEHEQRLKKFQIRLGEQESHEGEESQV